MGFVPDNSANAPGVQEAINAARDAATEKQQRISLYDQRLQDAISGAPQWGAAYGNSIGLNTNDPGIQAIIQQITGNIARTTPQDQDTTINPQSYFSDQAFAQGFGDATSRGRQANNAQVSGTFSPNYSTSLLPDNLVDGIVSDIVGEQRGLANTSVGYQSKRGLLTAQGTDQAQHALDDQTSAAKSTLNSLASGALAKDRGGIDDIVSQAGTAANAWNLGNPAFSVQPYVDETNNLAGRDTANFGGDVRAALGNTNLFNIPSIVAQAGTAQGAQNLTPGADLPAAAGVAQKKTSNASRGLGTAGGTF